MRFNGQKALAAGLTLGLVVLAGGCTTVKDHRGYVVDNTLIDAIQPGIDNRTSVERTLGRPTFASQFGEQDWYYISQNTTTAAFRRPRTKSQVVLRMRFDAAGNVVAVDKRGIEQVAQISPSGDSTPTLGRDRSFFEDLFGNVGSVGAGGQGNLPQGPGPNGS